MKTYLLLITTCLSLATYAQSPELEKFISHPIESGFSSSADGRNLAWVINDHGKRNIIVKVGNEPPKQLTSYTQDDGQEISQITFSPNGTIMLYVRGGSANPASLAEGTEQAIWFKDLTSKSSVPAKITTGGRPVFYKDGYKFIFSRDGQIFESPLDVNAAPKQLFQARGANIDPAFSPDGRSVLFTSDRGDHSFIGVYNLDTKLIKWISPDVTRDANPVWSPGGDQVAFVRTPGAKVDELDNLVGGTRFEIVVADARTGKGNSVWKSPADDGGFSQYYTNVPLAWTKTGRILFFSEHTGWLHMFSMTPTGGDVKDITPGDGEVENIVLDATGANIYFDGNREDINRRHIWKSDVTKGTPVAVTSGEGIEYQPAFAGNVLYCFRSTWNTSRMLVRVDENAKTTVQAFPQKIAVYAPNDFVKPEPVTFKAADGTTVHGQLFINRNLPGKRPGLVFMHGGPMRQMLLGYHYGDYYINCYAFNQYLANQGYAVIAVNYRCGTGYGKDFRRVKTQGPRGASEYQDVVAAAKHLQSLPEVDGGKIGLWGGSYGGYLTAMGLSRNPELFKAGVDIHGVHDWSWRARTFPGAPGGWWGIGKNEMDVAYKSSPSSDISRWTAPVLMIHGDDDRNVQFQETTDLATKLREKNVRVEILVLPDEVHGFLRYQSWANVFDTAKEFFDRQLKNVQ
ncbi:MAG TPA: alpha/beta fold hydrolase [Cyclobacteriaceae bacterium]|nr:alpha/beta fold hydrolase [Cyclobacteriaceae bacterium]